MSGPVHGALRRLGVVAVGLAAVMSCATSNPPSNRKDDALAVGDSSQKTQQEVQSELMAFADRYFAAMLDIATILERSLETPESRHTAAAGRLIALVATTDIAASPNPAAALLDMTVLVTLRRMVWEEYWMPEVYGEASRPVLDTYRELEAEIWDIAADVYSAEQLDQLRQLIDDWRSKHPDMRAVDFMRLNELGDARQVKALADAGRSGGMLAPVKEANRELEEMRLLAERLAFLVMRMQVMLSLQVEMASTKLAIQPEVQQLLEDSRTFAEVSDRIAEAFATLVADLPAERSAAIDQILDGLSEEREQLLADIGNENGALRPAIDDVRQTLETGRELAVVLGETIGATDTLIARMLEEDPARPFDIMDYRATLTDATIAVREIQTVLASIERILGSADIEAQLDPILESANRLEDEVVNGVIDRAFLRGVALIFTFFIVLTLYRLLLRRFAPDLLLKVKSE